jgi:hypothetical protein
VTLCFEMTQADARAALLYQYTMTPLGRSAVRRQRVTGAALEGAFTLLGAWVALNVMGKPVGPYQWAVIFTGVCAAMVLFLWVMQLTFPWQVAQSARKFGKLGVFDRFLGEHSVTLTPEGLDMDWKSGSASVKWSGIVRVEETDAHLLLYMTPNEIALVPRHAFADDAHYRAFR